MDSFQADATRWIRRQGLRRDVRIILDDRGLVFTDAAGRTATLAASRVTRLRHGVETARKFGPFHETRLWIAGESAPLILTAIRPSAALARVLNPFAAQVAAAGGTLETGLSTASAWWTGGLLSVPLAFAIAVCVLALRDQPPWQWAVVSSVPLFLAAVGLRVARRSRPRHLADARAFAAELDARFR